MNLFWDEPPAADDEAVQAPFGSSVQLTSSNTIAIILEVYESNDKISLAVLEVLFSVERGNGALRMLSIVGSPFRLLRCNPALTSLKDTRCFDDSCAQWAVVHQLPLIELSLRHPIETTLLLQFIETCGATLQALCFSGWTALSSVLRTIARCCVSLKKFELLKYLVCTEDVDAFIDVIVARQKKLVELAFDVVDSTNCDRVIDAVKSCSALTSLRTMSSLLRESAMDAIALGCRQLRHFQHHAWLESGAPDSEAFLKLIQNSCAQLQSVQCQGGSETLKQLALRHPGLLTIMLTTGPNEDVSDGFRFAVNTLRHLRHLTLYLTKELPAVELGLLSSGRCPNLEHLFISKLNEDDETVDNIVLIARKCRFLNTLILPRGWRASNLAKRDVRVEVWRARQREDLPNVAVQ